MPDRRFFTTEASLSLKDAAALIGAEALAGNGEIQRVAAPDETDLAGALVYCTNGDTASLLSDKTFGLCLATKEHAERISAAPVMIVRSPKLAFAVLAGRLHVSHEDRIQNSSIKNVIDESAEIHPTAVIGSGVKIGADVRIGPHAYVGHGVVIGKGGFLETGVCLTHAVLGEDVRILSGARIGQAGFGFVESDGGLERVPQLGRVMIGDNVEVGANSTIDRGALADTEIGEGAKIDNLVQIGHNVKVGRYCVIAAQSGVSGSCIIEDGVMIGGQVGLADHLTIGAGAQLAAGAGLMRDVPAGEKWGGRPARRAKDWLRETATLAKLAKKKNS